MQAVLLLLIFSLTSQFSLAEKEADPFTEGTRLQDGIDTTWATDSFTPTKSATLGEATLFLKKLFAKYGTNGLMTFEGFEHLLQSLGIGKVRIEDHDIHDHYTGNGFVDFHPNHNHTDQIAYEVDHHHHVNHSHHHNDHHINNENEQIDSPIHHVTDDKHLNHRSEVHSNHKSNNEAHDNHREDDHNSNIAHSNHDIQDYQEKNSRNSDSNGSELTYNETLKRLNRKDSYDPTLSSNVDYNSEEPNEKLRKKDKKARNRKEARNRNQKETGNINTNTSDDRIKRAAPKPRHEYSTKQCMAAREILNVYHLHHEGGISKNNFLNLCPAIIYQIDQHACNHDNPHNHDRDPIHSKSFCQDSHCSKDSHCHKYHSNHGRHLDIHNGHANISKKPVDKHSIFNVKPAVWSYASAAVTVISLVGLLSVAIVPIMRKIFFNYLIQYLVALAIGTLTGDALLHLLPHALVGHGSESAGHDSRDLSQKGAPHEASHIHNKSGVYKGLVALAGIYLFFLIERLMQNCTEWKLKRKNKRASRQLFHAKLENIGEKLSNYYMDNRSTEDIMMTIQTSRLQDDPELVEVSMDVNNDDLLEEQEENYGHSHGEEKIPQSISAIAWMVIMGDGLHNFSDGLAIGAAFADSVTGGLSTTVAVFCHELPHELGDFAVLLRAGMSVKQALFYNIVSSMLCYLGMLIGVAIGNLSAASLWIFALAGGMFIYISLVDMLPEITAPPNSKIDNQCCLTILQVLGITTGVCIMLLIALYEDKIKLLVGDGNGS